MSTSSVPIVRINSVDPTNNATSTTPIRPYANSYLKGGSWSNVSSTETGVNGLVATSTAWACILFRGSSLYITTSYYNVTSIRWWLDGYLINQFSAQTSNSTTITPLDPLQARFILDFYPISDTADHQFTFRAEATPERPVLIEFGSNSSDWHAASFGMDASELANATANADDSSAFLYYSSGWIHANTVDQLSWNSTNSVTTSKGSWVEVKFSAETIWFFGETGLYDARLNVTITDESGQIVRSNEHLSNGDVRRYIPLVQSPIFSETGLSSKRTYRCRVTLLTGRLALDYIRLSGMDATFLDVVGDSSVPRIDASTKLRIIIPLIIGSLMLGVLLYVLLRRKRSPKAQTRHIGEELGSRAGTIRSFHAPTMSTVVVESQYVKMLQQGGYSGWTTFTGSDTSSRPVSEESPFDDRHRVEMDHSTIDYPSEPSTYLNEENGDEDTRELDLYQLSQKDLERAHQRAKEIQALRIDGESIDPTYSSDRIEMLARQLAGMT
ncbi:SubName: Full=Uncharacterized protein {ECO:0000313/EMBL:CCA74694.1} [Serendipita indica DSM 11827]|nr:SubName: Full=Uncharacterized protein {ECO:0000313/EMBL:CCA74694.1} [Serendipita indica DSM 11827]